MKKIIHFVFVSLVVMTAGMTPSQAVLLQLTHEPLFLDESVPPAISVTLDDSGSMNRSSIGLEANNGTEITDPTINTLYFDPNIVYSPPLHADGTPYPDSDPENAMVDGYPNNMNDTVNLTKGYVAIRGFLYNRWDKNVNIQFADTQEFKINNIDKKYQNYHPDWEADRAYYSVFNTEKGEYESVFLFGDDLKNFANWYTYYNSRMKLVRAAISRAFQGFGPSFKLNWQELNRQKGFYNFLLRFQGGHKKDFYNWLFAVPTAGGTPLRSAFSRVTSLYKQKTSYFSHDYRRNLSCQQNFHIAVSDGGWKDDKTYNTADYGHQDEKPNSIPGDTDGIYNGYTGVGEQKIHPQTETGTTLSDLAFDAWSRDLVPDLKNNVRRFKKDYRDSKGVTLTFGAEDDPWESEAFVWNPKNNPAYWQHVVTFNVGLGLDASLVSEYGSEDASCKGDAAISDPKEAVYQALRDGTCSWPDIEDMTDGQELTKVDDVWHSSINSRGDFFSANDPNQLISALQSIVNNINEKHARGGTSTISSGVITENTLAFAPSFDSSTWSGNLQAFSVDDNGGLGNTQWDLACRLTDDDTGHCGQQTIRNIYTYDPVNQTIVEFDTTLGGALRAELKENAADLITRTNATVDDIIEYVRGNQNNEQSESGPFRDRISVLADIIHSSPTVVRGPGELYNDALWPVESPEYQAALAGNGYVNFKEKHLNRRNVVYVGSNSGMLHAVDAETGHEYWAYMPYKAFRNIHLLPDIQASHHSFVDNTAVKRDVFINGQWRTVLIGGMRYGGQGFYAIDVTNPGGTQPKVLWEFTDENDVDMGFSYGKADIVRISSTGEWVALIPNGYNNSQQDLANGSDPRNRISTSGSAVLYVVRVSDGSLLAKIDTNTGNATTPNGLSSPTGVDSEFHIGGSDNVFESKIDLGVDVTYAGDLYGNLWKFNMNSPDYSSWRAEKLVTADTDMHRPITIRPRVVTLPEGQQNQFNDVIVMFGTGKYIELPDRNITLPAEQYLVGVIDGLKRGSRPSTVSITSSGFVEQNVSSSGIHRQLSAKEVDLSDEDVYGWKVELPDQGERIANDMSLFGDQILLAATTVTKSSDPCNPTGTSWLMALNPLTGGVPESGKFFGSPYDPTTGTTTYGGIASGIKVDLFVVGAPTVMENIGGGNAIALAQGAEGFERIGVLKHTWRRRNWTNLLTE